MPDLLNRRWAMLLLLLALLSCSGEPSGPSNSSTATTGSLAVSVLGLPSGTSADLTVTGPEGYSQSLTGTATLSSLAPGTYTIAAGDVVAPGGTVYSGDPASQDASVTAQTTTTATVTYSPPSSGDLNLRIDGMYLTQSSQTYGGTVPLVQNRDGFLRVFVVANRTNLATPVVRVRFYQNLLLQSEVSIPAPGLSVPTAVDESSLSYSWNIPVQGSLIQPGISILAEVDTENAVQESNESDNAFPSGAPLSLDVRVVPTLDVTFVPVVQSGNGSAGNVSDGTKHDFLTTVTKMHPLADYNAVVHAPYTTTTPDTLEDDNGNGAWVTILQEIDMLRVAEAGSGYYYGVARVSYTSGIAGVAYVSNPAAGHVGRAGLGWDYLPSGSVVVAHELGHNWGREHAPCGDPASPDPSYPHSGGIIGVYGLDVAEQSLKSPGSSDIMGYCDSKWISDYTYTGVMNYLGSGSALVTNAEPLQASLLVWGSIDESGLRLEPAFHLNTRPKLPPRPGLYSLEALGSDGSRLAVLSFSPDQVADLPGRSGSFAYAVPMPATQAAKVAQIRLSGNGREATLRTSPPASPQVQVGRTLRGQVRLQWDDRTYPMVMVRDPETGAVLSLARRGQVELTTSSKQLALILSDGVRSTFRLVSVP